MADEKPEKCPEGHDAQALNARHFMAFLWNVECSECSWRGPYAQTEAEAIAAWNKAMRRSGPDAEAVEMAADVLKRFNPEWLYSANGEDDPQCRSCGAFKGLKHNPECFYRGRDAALKALGREAR